jgi:hypothetical protein
VATGGGSSYKLGVWAVILRTVLHMLSDDYESGMVRIRRMARHGTRHTARHGTARHDTTWHGTIRHGTTRHGTRHGTTRHGIFTHVYTHSRRHAQKMGCLFAGGGNVCQACMCCCVEVVWFVVLWCVVLGCVVVCCDVVDVRYRAMRRRSSSRWRRWRLSESRRRGLAVAAATVVVLVPEVPPVRPPRT